MDVHVRPQLKKDFAPRDGETVLAKLQAMPIETWSFITESGVRHAGPTAQDFRAAFALGTDDKSIGTTDINGIALKGVQAVATRTDDLRASPAAAQDEIRALNDRMARMEKLLAKSRGSRSLKR